MDLSRIVVSKINVGLLTKNEEIANVNRFDSFHNVFKSPNFNTKSFFKERFVFYFEIFA